MVTIVALIAGAVASVHIMFATKDDLETHDQDNNKHLDQGTQRMLGRIENSNERILQRLERIERHLDAEHDGG